jgi:hypothetical protein
LNEEYKIENKLEEGEFDALYSMISPALSVNKNSNDNYEESPESSRRLTTGTKGNSQNNIR